MSTRWADGGGSVGRATPAGRPPTDRVPRVVLLARPARRRAPTAVIWQLVTYDRRTRVAVADIAQRWQPAGTGPDFGDGQDGTVPEPVHQWLASVLGPGTTVTGPASDYAGPASWHIGGGTRTTGTPNADLPASDPDAARTDTAKTDTDGRRSQGA